MKCFKLILLLIAGSFSLVIPLQAQTITQEEFLNHLRRVHPLFEKEKLTAQIEKENRKSYLGAEDWNIFSTVNFFHQEPSIAIAGPEQADALMLEGGVKRIFWRTGGRLSASFSSNWSTIEIDPFYGFPESFYENKIALTYVHPLMKNKNGFLDQLQYELKQFDIDFSEVEALENQEDFLANSAAKFLDWVILTEQKKIVSERLKLSEEELERTKKKREAHLVDQVDVIRAEDAVRIAKQSQMLVEAQTKAVQAELAELSLKQELYDLSPEFDLYQFQELIPLEEAVLQVKENSRIIKVLNIRLKQLVYSRRGFEETLKPDLSLVAQLNTKNLDESFGKALGMDKPDALLGVQLSFPLENRTARSQVSRTDLQITRLEKQVEEITLSLVSAVTNLHIQIKEMEKVLELNQEQIESSKQKTQEELKLYNQGRGSLTFVIQSRDSEQNAKLTYAQNSIFYHQLSLQYHSLMDELLSFDLEDQD
jgi:outer membrane protein TolC